MKSILTAVILSLISAVAIAQSPVQRQRQVPAKVKTQSTVQAVLSVGALAGAVGGAAAASYAATGMVSAPTTNPADTIKNAAQRRRVEVLKSNKTGDPNAITLNPLYESQGLSGQNAAARAINESGVSVKSDSKPKKK